MLYNRDSGPHCLERTKCRRRTKPQWLSNVQYFRDEERARNRRDHSCSQTQGTRTFSNALGGTEGAEPDGTRAEKRSGQTERRREPSRPGCPGRGTSEPTQRPNTFTQRFPRRTPGSDGIPTGHPGKTANCPRTTPCPYSSPPQAGLKLAGLNRASPGGLRAALNGGISDGVHREGDPCRGAVELNLSDYRKKHWEGSFDEYLDIVREHPR